MAGLLKATRALKANSSAGFDNVTPRQFRAALLQTDLGTGLIEDLKTGRYRPGPLRRVCIPKPNGTQREIYIPSVQDRVVQKLIVNAITPLVEARSSQHSYGFRPHRNVQQAVRHVSQLVKAGYRVCLLVDLKNFFGNIKRERLRALLRNYPIDPALRELVNAFIKAKAIDMVDASASHGIPAGMPLAPTLANIYLTPLDNDLAKRGVKFVRYADDITLLFRSEHECRSLYMDVSDGWEERFGLRINHQKTEIVSQGHRSVLGFKIGDYGGVTASTLVTDVLAESLTDLLSAANVPLGILQKQIKVEVHC
ncbi:MAG: reverse transcriptase domain-containing protein [Bdellovibrionales bacterium]